MQEPAAVLEGREDLAAWREEAGRDAWENDPFFRGLLTRLLGAELGELEPLLRRVSEKIGPELDERVQRCNLDENLPRVQRHDEDGRPIETVVFHPDHHEVGRVFWGSRVLSLLEKPGREVAAGAVAYLLDRHGEAGHACPVACTAGAIRLIQRLGTPEQKERYLPSLLVPDYDRRLHAAQFVTELQGGSDVGANACRAVPDPERPGWYRISGEKWFCSVADAGLFVVSSRLEDGGEGTRGLGLFLVPRELEGRPNGFALRRLKRKLGTRSMPTGEIEFDGALGEPIGATRDGFRNLVSIVLDTSRVHNAIAACGLLRRAFAEARSYARHRRAFGRPILDFPGVQEILARMRVRTLAALGTTFHLLALSDRLDREGDDEELLAARRVAVMVNKYWTAIAATASARDGIEILGGNGTIEDFSVLPRLYRDAIVIESWEGTHNTLCAQILRDFEVRGLHRPWLAVAAREVETLAVRLPGSHADRAKELLEEVRGRIGRLLEATPELAAAHVRHVVDRMAVLTDWTQLALQAAWEVETGDRGAADALELYRRFRLDSPDPQEDPERVGLQRRLASREG